jgi:hypothetical protein
VSLLQPLFRQEPSITPPLFIVLVVPRLVTSSLQLSKSHYQRLSQI